MREFANARIERRRTSRRAREVLKLALIMNTGGVRYFGIARCLFLPPEGLAAVSSAGSSAVGIA